MDDLELLRLSARAIGLTTVELKEGICIVQDGLPMNHWNPLSDRAQAFRLVEELRLNIFPYSGQWGSSILSSRLSDEILNADLRRAIVECAARVQQEREKAK